MAELIDALREAGRSLGSAHFLVGEAGVGKSRLVRELTSAARREQSQVLLGRATRSSGTVAYRPVAEALLSYFRDEDLPNAAELAPFRGVLSRLLPQWQRDDAAASDASIVLLAEAILRLLRIVGRGGGCLLVLEDLHWADSETLAIVEYLSENLATEPVTLLCTTRSEESGPSTDLVDTLVSRRVVAVTNLQRLTPAETAAMARACLSTSELPGSVEELLTSNADGLPFFVEELLAGAVDAGTLVNRDGSWVAHGPVEAHAPRTFAESVHRRMESLGDSARILLAAAVLGRRVDWTLLCDVTGDSQDAVLGALRAGVDAQLLVADSAATASVHFRHALTRDAVIGRLLPAERAVIARRALDAVVTAHPGLPGEWCALGAGLAEQAGDPRVAGLLVESGMRSLRSGALATAEETLRRAVALATDAEVRAEATEALCETLATAGKVDSALEVGKDLLPALHAVGASAQRIGLVHSRLAAAAAAATRWADALHHLELARDGCIDPTVLARVDVIAAQLAYSRGLIDEAAVTAQTVLADAERLGLHDLTCEALWVIGHCARVSDVLSAESAYQRALEVAEQHGLESLRIRALFELGTIDFMTLRPPDHLVAARDLASSAGALSTVAQIDMHLLACFMLRFDNKAAIAAGMRVNEAARRLHMPELAAMSLTAVAAAYGRLGNRDHMESLIGEAFDVAGDEVTVAGLMWAHCRAELSLIDENRPRARREMDTMMDILRRNPGSPPVPERGLWALLRAVEDDDGAAAVAEVQESGTTSQIVNRGLVHYAEAVLAGRAGRHDEAERAFATADETMANVSWYRHLARRLVAEAAITDGWGEPPLWLRDALREFDLHGQERLAAACRSLLRKAGAPVPRRRPEARVPQSLRSRGITEREAEVLTLLADGLGNNEIATRLYLSPRTVERHVANLTAKTNLRTRTELVAFAARAAR